MHELFREQLESEPVKMGANVDKIIEGKMRKRLSELSLLQQNHMVETGAPIIEKYLKTLSTQLGSELKLDKYALWTIGQKV